MYYLGQPKAQVAKTAASLSRAVNKLTTVQTAFDLQAWESLRKMTPSMEQIPIYSQGAIITRKREGGFWLHPKI